MITRFPRLLCAVLLCLSLGRLPAAPAEAEGAIACSHPLALAAGREVLQRGGNAVDAAVAVGLTLGVVDTYNSGIGGGCFLLIRLANGRIVAIDGRETAPAAATRDMFVREGKADTRLSQTGALASGVPGELAAFDYALRRYGRKRLADLILPAADLAERGFVIDQRYAERLEEEQDDLRRFAASRSVFFREDRPLKAGEVLKQPDLGKTYREIAELGPRWFYRGEFARRCDEWMRANAGLLRASDFARYRPRAREPVIGSYRGSTVVSFPPPSSGGVHLIQMLNVLERFPMREMDEADRMHVTTEAMKLAFADRAYWLGDPGYARVPKGVLSSDYARERGAAIHLRRSAAVEGHGNPPRSQEDIFKKHTTHWSVADRYGNWVACTATINTSFGSKVVIPGTGVVMNNQMDDFSVQPGVANYFGLVGAEANAVEPGKRPLSSMTPTIVLRNGEPFLATGAAGGPKIITAVLVQLVCLLDLNTTAQQAMEAPRFHHQWRPDELVVENGVPDETIENLEARGHTVKRSESALSVSHLVYRNPGTGRFEAVADPRSGGSAWARGTAR